MKVIAIGYIKRCKEDESISLYEQLIIREEDKHNTSSTLKLGDVVQLKGKEGMVYYCQILSLYLRDGEKADDGYLVGRWFWSRDDLPDIKRSELVMSYDVDENHVKTYIKHMDKVFDCTRKFDYKTNQLVKMNKEDIIEMTLPGIRKKMELL